MSILKSLGFIVQHPLTRNARISALVRWLRWQVGSRLLMKPVIIPFVNDTQLICKLGMKGATGNLYCGLHEFEDMALVLHALRSEDVFIDIGSNVGSYTILGGGAVGAYCVSIEPIPNTFEWLHQNIAINGLIEQVQALNIGLGRVEGTLRFTDGLDTVNHIVGEDENVAGVIEVQIRTLDAVVGDSEPTLIKIDVEGFETEVVAGAERALTSPNLLAVIMEINGSGSRYGFDEDALHQLMIDKGFETYRYYPFERRLESLQRAPSISGNTLYVRDIEKLSNRVQTAPQFQLGIGVDI